MGKQIISAELFSNIAQKFNNISSGATAALNSSVHLSQSAWISIVNKTSPIRRIPIDYAVRINNVLQGSREKIKNDPWNYLSIPFFAAFVGYVTNWLGVKMLFYPNSMGGISNFKI